MIPIEVVNESFRRPLTSPVDRKDKERRKLEEDMRKFLKAGGKVTRVKRGASHDLSSEGTTLER